MDFTRGSIVIAGYLSFVISCLSVSSSREYHKLATHEKERIRSLPGISELPEFPMYSGYLTVTEEKKLHYWLNMCAMPDCSSLIIWFNGGPGCSSMDGLLNEHGPFKLNIVTGKLEANVHSWNKLASTLYIEAPAGVGFSYDLLHEPMSDDTVAVDIEKAILDFLEKFQVFTNTDIYICGESYAGVYLPILAGVIMDSGSTLKDQIKGFAVGNGLLSTRMNEQSLVYFAYYHGLFGISIWNDLMKFCCTDGRPDRCDFYQFRNEECMMQAVKVIQIVSNSGLNVYNLYQYCTTPTQRKMMGYLAMKKEILFHMAMNGTKFTSLLNLVPLCTNATFVTRYFNDVHVQRSIHVKPTRWEVCSDEVHRSYRKLYDDMTPFIQRIIREMDSRILFYFGDVDMACNHIGGEWFTDRLQLKVTAPRRSWNVLAEDGSQQVAGFVKRLDKVTYITIKGAGHMVPADKPRVAFFMMERFINHEPF